MTLEKYLNDYKSLTLEIIKCIDVEGNIKKLYDEREKILVLLNDSNFDKNEMKKISEDLQLVELENAMILKIKNEQSKIKKRIQNLRKMEQGNNQYMSIGYVSSKFNRFS